MSGFLIPVLAFVCAALAVGLVLYLLTAGQRRVGRRLTTMGSAASEPDKGSPKRDPFPTLTSLIEGQGRHSAIEAALERAGSSWRPSELVAVSAAAIVVVAALGWLVWGPLGAAAGIVIAVSAPFIVLKVLEVSRLRRFERQLPDALMLIASSLRSGYGVLRAMQAVCQEMEPPISVEFGKVLDETNVGVPTPEALVRLSRRVPLSDLDIAVTAMLIQLEVGGNLAEVMEIVASTVRERQRIRAEVNTLTAEGRMSGLILFILPIAMAVILGALNPSYMSALFTTSLGHLLMACAIGLQIVGGVVIMRMLRLDY
ncbi:MAG: type II secretion system F family protein [Armatimonadota bacterium]|nr:MAG: type II secretion system F family protein [Armatimonadota bacterium]